MHIVTIGGGNGQSYLLRSLKNLQKNHSSLQLTSIVSMSDDGRTTGKLMKVFDKYLGVHLPPPGDLRRPLYVLSQAQNVVDLETSMEEVLNIDRKLSDMTLKDYLDGLRGISNDRRTEIEKQYSEILGVSIAIEDEKVEGYKRGNLLMACLFCAYAYSLEKVMDAMHDILDVDGQVIPVTCDKALIQAITRDGQIIKTQDVISNHPELYTGPIDKLELMDDSRNANMNPIIPVLTQDANYIIVTPGDIYTSLVANFIVDGVREWIGKNPAKLVFVMNPTNKGGEAEGLSADYFINILERYIGRPFDIILANNLQSSTDGFSDDISVKGGEYIYLSAEDKKKLKDRGTQIYERDLIDEKSNTYRFDQEKITDVMREVLL
ncbi:MAG: 2-phospho-L-lactate transferase CofD family protein [Candidatus Gracilibacteria bacterium]